MSTAPLYLDATLTPNRSLSPAALAVFCGAFGVVSLVLGLIFLSRGAFPVIGFLGLDALALYVAFRISQRHQAQSTRVTVCPQHIRLHHKDHRGERTAELPTAFTRVELDSPAGPTSWLRLAHGARVLIIGRFLTPGERESFAKALRTAIHRAQTWRGG